MSGVHISMTRLRRLTSCEVSLLSVWSGATQYIMMRLGCHIWCTFQGDLDVCHGWCQNIVFQCHFQCQCTLTEWNILTNFSYHYTVAGLEVMTVE